MRCLFMHACFYLLPLRSFNYSKFSLFLFIVQLMESSSLLKVYKTLCFSFACAYYLFISFSWRWHIFFIRDSVYLINIVDIIITVMAIIFFFNFIFAIVTSITYPVVITLP